MVDKPFAVRHFKSPSARPQNKQLIVESDESWDAFKSAGNNFRTITGTLLFSLTYGNTVLLLYNNDYTSNTPSK
jgi:hypothetical protein